MISDNFTLWEAKGEFVNIQVVLFCRVTKLSSVDVGCSVMAVQVPWPQGPWLRINITGLVKRCIKRLQTCLGGSCLVFDAILWDKAELHGVTNLLGDSLQG